MLGSCGNSSEDTKEDQKIKIGAAKKEAPAKTQAQSSEPTIDLNNKGIGPITKLDLPATIDPDMVTRGDELFRTKCGSCHKPSKRFIGPAPVGIMERRSPEWIMNMILNPEEMTKNDPIARQLLIEYNGSPMANQSLTETEARSILEYFRTLK